MTDRRTDILNEVAAVAAELLAGADQLEGLILAALELASALPRALAHWLQAEIKTPESGAAPPTILHPDGGLWSGIVLAHRNRGVAWILVHVDGEPEEERRSIHRRDRREVGPSPWWDEEHDFEPPPWSTPRGGVR